MYTTRILADLTTNLETFRQALPVAVGALVVIGTLATLWGICELNARLIKFFLPNAENEPTRVAQVTGSAAASTPPGEATMQAELVAVISAAVAATIDEPVRIVSIKPQDDTWEKAGRRSVLTSHRVR